MKQNSEFLLSTVAGNHVLVPIGPAAVNFNAIVTLNETGKVIWELLAEETDTDALLAAILREYEVSEEQAKADLDSFLSTLRENGCILE